MKVRLEARAGYFVTAAEILDAYELPDVIQCAGVTYVLASTPTVIPTYREAVMAVATPVKDEPKS